MTKSEFRDAVRTLLTQPVAGLLLDEKDRIVRQCLLEAAKAVPRNVGNTRNPWTDEELRVILLHAPTQENCMLLADAFRRGYGSIEQIFRWAATSDKEAAAKRPNDVFVEQIRRVAKQIGWRAT